MVREAQGPSLQERIEGSGPGRALISLVIMVTLVAVVVINLPESHLRRSLSKVTQPYLNAVGLDQAWGVFAPDPRRESLRLEVQLQYADGKAEVWRAPARNDVFGGYSDYRWRKLEENVLAEGVGEGASAESLARWVVREQRERSEVPTMVTVQGARSPLPPPGPNAGNPSPYVPEQLLQMQVTPQMAGEGG